MVAGRKPTRPASSSVFAVAASLTGLVCGAGAGEGTQAHDHLYPEPEAEGYTSLAPFVPAQVRLRPRQYQQAAPSGVGGGQEAQFGPRETAMDAVRHPEERPSGTLVEQRVSIEVATTCGEPTEQGVNGGGGGIAGVHPAFEAEDEGRVLEAGPALDRREVILPPRVGWKTGYTIRGPR